MRTVILLQVVLASLRALSAIWKARGRPAAPKALEELPEPQRTIEEPRETATYVVHYDD